jgi:UDP-3-O-[3-hydroxymyristoyl] N-acetylglucosamine deacetylase
MTKYALSNYFERSGVGLHSGIKTTVRVLPGLPGNGRYFVRVDLPESPVILANVEAVKETTLSTQLQGATAKASVRTVEHLLAALAASGIEDARIEIDGPEVPLLDGSAKNWVEAIHEAGVVALPETSPAVVLQEAVAVYDGDAFVTALPAPTLRFTYGIDFDLPALGNQWHSWTPEEDFGEAIAPARTFGLAHQIEQLQNRGLIKGGSLENALVCGEQGWLNGPLRFPNEPVRHKLLDLVGDLSLLGNFPIAHFLSYKASHNLHIQLAKKLAMIFR